MWITQIVLFIGLYSGHNFKKAISGVVLVAISVKSEEEFTTWDYYIDKKRVTMR